MTYRLVLFLFLSYQPEYCAFCCHCRCFCRRRSCWLFVLKVSTINYKLMCVFNKYKQTAIVVGMCNLPAGQPAGCLTKRRTRRPEQTTRDVWPGGATNKPQPTSQPLSSSSSFQTHANNCTLVALARPPYNVLKKIYYMIS